MTTFKWLFPNAADAAKLGTCYVLGFASLVYCFYAAATRGAEPHIQVLICILGSSIGWCVGMYLTPDSEGETKRFSEFGKVILMLGAGVGIAKAPDLVDIAKPLLFGDAATTSSLRFLLFSCCLLIFGTATYIARIHVRGVDDERRKKRDKLIGEMQKSLHDLSAAN